MQQEIVERLHRRGALALGQLASHVGGQLQLEVDQLRDLVPPQRGARVAQQLAGVEEGVLGREPGTPCRRTGLLEQRAAAEGVEQLELELRAGVRVAQEGVHELGARGQLRDVDGRQRAAKARGEHDQDAAGCVRELHSSVHLAAIRAADGQLGWASR